ncbi:MAG TPA: type II secretion system protein GspG [Phycisphaerae bacterium]|nr:type II secretion system protein GspG [Phycisphaerae bacterium]HRR85865.1 type II secretion system protein GspG [Phycisphaerae bacterium]
MVSRTCRWMLAITLLTAAPVRPAEEPTTASAPTSQGIPAISGSALSDLLPAKTLLYKGWPGIDVFSKAAEETELAKLLKEPELERLRASWWKDIWPAIKDQIARAIGDEKAEQILDPMTTLLGTVWRHPTAVALIGAGTGKNGPQFDAAIIVRAGKDSAKLVEIAEQLLALAGITPDSAMEVEVGRLKFKTVTGFPLPLRWGRAQDLFVVSLGTKATEHLGLGTLEDSLTRSPRFAAAMKHVGADQSWPFFFLDMKAAVQALKDFQPMLAATSLPFFAEPDALDRFLKQMGVEACESLSIAIAPEAGGFKTSMFVHLPGAAASSNPLIGRKALINDDIRVVPKNVRWATVTNWDAAATYRSLLDALTSLVPTGEEEILGMVERAERRLGLSIEKEILGAFEDNWAIFDSPEFGGIWVSGITVVAKVKPKHHLRKAMRNITAVIAEEMSGDASAEVATETYRGQTIEYFNISGVPLPIAPAWAEFQGRWIMALYPQMVRMELDHLMNRGASLLENPDYQRGRKLLPNGAFAVNYVDTKSGMLQMYSLALPIWQAAAAMLQKENIPLDVSMLPSAHTVTRHLFGNVSVSIVSEDGALTVSHGALPVPVPAIGEGGFAIPLGAAILLPSLSRARVLAKRTASAANLSGLGKALYTYAVEHDDQFPPDLRTLVDSGAISEKSLRSPLDESDATSSYIYISGQTTEVDQRNVIAYENPENHDNEGTVVLFADSHVEFMTMSAFRKALEDTYRRLGREMEEPGEQVEARTRDQKTAAARRAVSREGALAAALELFKMHVGRYPNKLDELVEQPESEADAEKWRGPYVQGAGALKDPWGHRLMYLSPGERNRSGYDLWSLGPDGQDGTTDDLANWKK